MTQMLADYYRDHRDELVERLTAVLRGDRMTAEDMVQQAFLRLLGIGVAIMPATLPALVSTMLRRQLIDLWRRRRREADAARELSLQQCCSADDPLSVLSMRQVDQLLESRLARLDPDSRAILQMDIRDGAPVSEIASRLGLRYKTVEYRLGQARRQVRSFFRHLA